MFIFFISGCCIICWNFIPCFLFCADMLLLPFVLFASTVPCFCPLYSFGWLRAFFYRTSQVCPAPIIPVIVEWYGVRISWHESLFPSKYPIHGWVASVRNSVFRIKSSCGFHIIWCTPFEWCIYLRFLLTPILPLNRIILDRVLLCFHVPLIVYLFDCNEGNWGRRKGGLRDRSDRGW